MVSNSKLVENLIYIDGYMTPVSNEYDYEEKWGNGKDGP